MQKLYKGEIIKVPPNFDSLSREERKRIVLEQYNAIEQSKNNQPVELNLDYLSQTIGNLPESSLQLAKDTITPFVQPIETAKTLGDLGASVINLALPEQYEIGDNGEKMARAVGDYFSDRYGSIDGVKKSFRDDPLGVASDIASVMSLGVLGAGKLGKIAKIADEGTVTSAQNISRKIDLFDPTAWLAKGTGMVVGTGANLTRKGLTGLADFYSDAPISKTYEAARRSPIESQAITRGRRNQIDQEGVVDTLRDRAFGEKGLIDSLKTTATDLKNVAFGQRVATDRPIDAEIIPESKDVAKGDEDFTVPGQQKDTVKVEAKELGGGKPTLIQGNFENVLNNWQKYKNSDRFFYKTDTGAIDFSDPLDLSKQVTDAITGIDKILQRASNRAPTLENLDNLKRAIDEAYTDIDLPNKQKTFVNEAVASVRSDIKNAILDADKSGKYAKSMAEYEKAYKLRESLVKDLNLGKQKTALQSYNKIKKIFSQNPDYDFGIIQTTIDDLDKKREIRGGILGEEARNLIPSYKVSPISAVKLGSTLSSGVGAGLLFGPAGVATVGAATSPRIASSMAQLLGKSRRALDPITSRNVGLAQSGRLLQSGINPAQETDPDEYRGFVKNLLGIK
tara:strand:+ start:1505 stop:3370 length:1866 start_codon:yes stop_codon:yes gene_type:complete